MEVDEAIVSRASVKRFTDQEVPRELIEQCLELAVWAPNHRLTEPWRFRVIVESARETLADVISEQMTSDAHMDKGTGFGNAEGKGLFSSALQFTANVKNAGAVAQVRKKLMSAPALVLVYSLRSNMETVTKENYAATSAAVQNLLLGAHHLGLAAIWRTADYFSGEMVRAYLQIPTEADCVAAVYLGFAEQREMSRKRTPSEQMTVWFGQ